MMQKSLFLVLFFVACTSVVSAEGVLQAEGLSEGSTIIWFRGSRIETTFDGTQELRGTLELGITEYSFAVAGSAYGAGTADANTLQATLWVLVRVSGTLEGGTPITIRGGMNVGGEDIDMDSLSLGAGGGTFFFIVDLFGSSYEFKGTIDSTATGTLVPPEIPSTMEVAGRVDSTFEGSLHESTGELVERLPWDVSSWPQKLHEQLITLLLTGVMPERTIEQPETEPERPPARQPPPP